MTTTTEPELTTAGRLLFAQFADELIPAEDGLPAPSALDVQGAGLARLAALLPESAAAVAAAIDRAGRSGVDSVDELRSTAPEDFKVISEAVAGIYLTEKPVMDAYGYQGRRPIDVGDPHARVAEYGQLVAPVVQRGWIWHGDGSSGIAGETSS